MRIPLFVLFAVLSGVPISVGAASWPTTTVSTISSALTATLPPSGRVFEPSDIALMGSGLVLVSDEGDVAQMNDDGTGLTEWLVEANADLEGVAVDGDTLYVLHERNRDVYAYSATTHERLATYDLSPWITGSDNLGPEALAVVASTLYVGHQATGVVYEFTLANGEVSLATSWSTGMSVTGIAPADDGKLYVLGSGVVRVYADDGSQVEYTLPTQPQAEGIAVRVNCAMQTASVFIANDTGPVYRYDGFPAVCPTTLTFGSESTTEVASEPEPAPAPVDADGDGVAVDTDCNDADAMVSVAQTYYRDADADTLGSATESIAVCSASAPAGYVANAHDTNDALAYFSAVGTTDGSIVVTYGDGSTATYQVFAMTTATPITNVAQYKESGYLVVYGPFEKRVAVVNPYTGAVVAMRWVPRSSTVLASWLVKVIGY